MVVAPQWGYISLAYSLLSAFSSDHFYGTPKGRNVLLRYRIEEEKKKEKKTPCVGIAPAGVAPP